MHVLYVNQVRSSDNSPGALTSALHLALYVGVGVCPDGSLAMTTREPQFGRLRPVTRLCQGGAWLTGPNGTHVA